MADEDLNLGDGGKPSSKKKLILFSAVGLVALLGVGISLYALGVLGGGDSQSPGSAQQVTGQVESKPVDEAIYHKISPDFIVNFPTNKSARLLQATVEIMARDQEHIAAVKTHAPMIKNNLLMLLGGQDPAVLRTRKGKEALRKDVLKEIQRVLMEETGEPGIEAVYFTGFVMQ